MSFSRLSSKLLSVSCKEEERESRYTERGRRERKEEKTMGKKLAYSQRKVLKKKLEAREQNKGERGEGQTISSNSSFLNSNRFFSWLACRSWFFSSLTSCCRPELSPPALSV